MKILIFINIKIKFVNCIVLYYEYILFLLKESILAYTIIENDSLKYINDINTISFFL